MRFLVVILFCCLIGLGAGVPALGQGYPTNDVHALMTNDLATNSAAESTETNFETASQLPPVPETEVVIPKLDLNEVPITSVIEALARQAGINYQIDLRCETALAGSVSKGIPEPVINLHLTNVKASEVLGRLLDVRGFALVEDPVTTVAWVIKKGLPPKTLKPDLLTAGKEPSAAGDDNTFIPVMSFSDVPIDVVLGNLATQAGGNLYISHAIEGADYAALSLHWQNITAKQAILALCENYNFSFMGTNAPGVVYIVPLPGAQ